MGTSYHMCLSVKGALMNWTEKELGTLLQDDGGRTLSAKEARAYLLDELAKGHEKLPMGRCDNFDWKKGCLGHSEEEPSS